MFIKKSKRKIILSPPLCVCACVCWSPLTSLPPQSGFRRQFCESKWDNKTTWQRQYNTAILLIVNKPKFSHFANCFGSLGKKHRKVERKKEAQIESIIIKHANIGSAANFFQRREKKNKGWMVEFNKPFSSHWTTAHHYSIDLSCLKMFASILAFFLLGCHSSKHKCALTTLIIFHFKIINHDSWCCSRCPRRCHCC